jgi:nucleotide-binding universal stress UspA family protein
MKLLEPKASTAVSVKNVLVATDFSQTSEDALPYAVAISRRYGSTLHAVHVIADADFLVPSQPVDATGFTLEAALRESWAKMHSLALRLEGLPHYTYVLHGRVGQVISDLIRVHQIDLLVVGTHGRSGVEKLLLGSVAEDVLRRASCSVLTVGPQVSGRAKLPVQGDHRDLPPIEIDLRQIVYATDFTPNSVSAATYAISLAQEFQARITLMHVMEKYVDLDRRPGPIADAVQRLEELVPRDAALWCTPEHVLEYGSPAEHILRTASERNADLIVLGAQPENGATGVATHLPWATAHKVIAHAHCPVLTVRGPSSV